MDHVIRTMEKNETFVSQYTNNEEMIKSYFDYFPLNKNNAVKKYEESVARNYPREALATALYSYNKKFEASEKTFENIEKLREEDSVVIIGGQQAGLLTGPLYTINKILSILIEANRLQKSLNKTVIPVFWIAGEDHDVDEINHFYIKDKMNLFKIKLDERNDIKTPASERFIKKEEAKEVLKHAFRQMHETDFTKEVYTNLMHDLRGDLTYSSWFAILIHRLLKDTGIVLLDAHDPDVRKIEKPYFIELIKKNEEIRTNFVETAKCFKESGFGEPISIEKENAHLFFHEENQRFLLEYKNSLFKEKNGTRSWTEDELIRMVENGTLQLSNNVVSRPLMQDLILPVHTFIAGPGELVYWGTLKGVFSTFNRHMPLVFPRHHFTFISRTAEKYLQFFNLSIVDIFEGKLEEVEKNILDTTSHVDEVKLFQEAKQEIASLFTHLSTQLEAYGSYITDISNRSESKVQSEIARLEKKVTLFKRELNEAVLNKLKTLENECLPHSNLQERTLNILSFLNLYGESFLSDLFNEIIEKIDEVNAGDHIDIYL